MPLLGAHVSAAGGAHTAFARGRAIGCDALQIFVKNASRWQARPISDEQVSAFRSAHADEPMPLVAHASYLINLCSSDPGTLERSQVALSDELGRCSALGIPALVLHPGAHLGAGETAGLEQIARSLDRVFSRSGNSEVRVLLENTAGQGTVLGSHFEQLARIIALVDTPERLGVCFDSCHAFAAGYDLRSESGYHATFAAVEEALGLQRLGAIHLNDSKFPLGSNRDRHENIGQGQIGDPFFARLLADERLASLPMLLETPLGDDGEGHRRDLERLRGL